MDDTKFYLQWNIVNWITVVLMASIGMMAVAAISSGIRQYTANPAADGSNA